MPELMRCEAPYPDALADVVADLRFWPGWSFTLHDLGRHEGAHGLTLTIAVQTIDAYDHTESYLVTHHFWVPPESWDCATWAAWVLDRIMDVHWHETAEAFNLLGERPFAPGHGGGTSPYRPATVSTRR